MRVIVSLLALLLIGTQVQAKAQTDKSDEVAQMCKKISGRLASVSYKECSNIQFYQPRFYSASDQPILEAHYAAKPGVKNPVRILFIGGIHGDELSSVSVTFKWLNKLNQHHSGSFDWHFLPLANPDGLLRRPATRVNANNVDLNRNFIPAEAKLTPLEYWKQASKRKRYYPGEKPLSEPESKMIHTLIEEYKPSVIVSVHAPHGILDFDGDKQPPQKLGPLYLRHLGTYPGSLGNYGWYVKNVPVMTIELPYAGIMPSATDISRMWVDLVRWVRIKAQPESQVAEGADEKGAVSASSDK